MLNQTKNNIMKKITLFVLSIVALASAAMAQGAMTINAVDFTSNPARFNGKTIAIAGVKLDLTAAAAPTGAVSPAGGGAAIPGLAAAPGPATPGAPGAIRCNPPRGFKSIEVDFTNDPSFSKCFFISEAQYNALPKGHALTAQLTFKGSDRLGYTITMFKLQ
jgi:hypothetical protein